jgi:hypothetical protein
MLRTKFLFDSSRHRLDVRFMFGPKPRFAMREGTAKASQHPRIVTIAPLPPQPVVQVGRTEPPESAYAPRLYLAPAGHFLERLGMNAEQSSGFG